MSELNSIIDLTTSDEKEVSENKHNGDSIPTKKKISIKSTKSKGNKSSSRDQRKQRELEDKSEEEDDEDDFVETVLSSKAKLATKSSKSTDKTKQSTKQTKLSKDKKGEVTVRESANATLQTDDAWKSADYVLKPDLSVGIDEDDVQMNRLRIEMAENSRTIASMEKRNMAIRKEMKAIEKKQREKQRSTLSRFTEYFQPGDDSVKENTIAQLFPLQLSDIDSFDMEAVVNERRLSRQSRPFYYLQSMHSQVDSVTNGQSARLEMRCVLQPLESYTDQEEVQCKVDESEVWNVHGGDAHVEGNRDNQERSAFSQLLMLVDEAEVAAIQSSSNCACESSAFGRCSPELDGYHCNQSDQPTFPFTLPYASQALESVFLRTCDVDLAQVLVQPSVDRATFWLDEQRRQIRLVQGFLHASQLNTQNSQIRDGLATFASLWSEIFESVAPAADLDTESAAGGVKALMDTNLKMQQLLRQNEMVLSELQANIEALLRTRQEQAGRGLEECEMDFLQGLLASCFTARVLSDGGLLGSRHCEILYDKLLQIAPETRTIGKAADQMDESMHICDANMNASPASSFRYGDEWDDAAIICGGNDEPNDHYCDYFHDDGDVHVDCEPPRTAGKGVSIDLISPDSLPMEYTQSQQPSQSNRIVIIDSSGKKPVPPLPEDESFFCDKFYALGPHRPDFASATPHALELNCVDIGLPRNTKRETAMPILINVWEQCYREFELKNAQVAAPGKNKRNKNDEAAVREKPNPTKKQRAALPEEETNAADKANAKHNLTVDQASKVVAFIRDNARFYERLLLFRPLDIDELHSGMRGAIPSIKVSKDNLKQFLDAQAVFVQQGSLSDKYAAYAGANGRKKKLGAK